MLKGWEKRRTLRLNLIFVLFELQDEQKDKKQMRAQQ